MKSSNYPLEYQSYLTNNVSGPSKLVFQKTSLISIETDFQEGVFILYVLSRMASSQIFSDKSKVSIS